LGITREDFYKLDAAELYWAYKVWREKEDQEYEQRYEVARFLGILIKNPKLLPRLREVLPFFWEKDGGAPKKQSVADMKKAIMAIAGAQGISKGPLPKLINLRQAAKRKREEQEKRKQKQGPKKKL